MRGLGLLSPGLCSQGADGRPRRGRARARGGTAGTIAWNRAESRTATGRPARTPCFDRECWHNLAGRRQRRGRRRWRWRPCDRSLDVTARSAVPAAGAQQRSFRPTAYYFVLRRNLSCVSLSLSVCLSLSLSLVLSRHGRRRRRRRCSTPPPLTTTTTTTTQPRESQVMSSGLAGAVSNQVSVLC